MVSRLTGCRLHDHNCGFKVYRREVLDEVGIYGELHRFVPVLAHARGFRVGEIEVNHRARQVRHVEVRRRAVRQGVARPADRPLPDPVRPAAAARPGGRRPGAAGARRRWACSTWPSLWLDWATGRSATGRCCSTRRALLGVGTQLLSLGILAELVTVVQHPARGHVQRRRDASDAATPTESLATIRSEPPIAR